MLVLTYCSFNRTLALHSDCLRFLPQLVNLIVYIRSKAACVRACACVCVLTMMTQIITATREDL